MFRIGLAVLLIWFVGAAVAVMLLASRPPDFSSSPLTSRKTPTFDSDSPIGLLEKLREPAPSGRPTAEPFANPLRLDGEDDSFVLYWKDETEVDSDTMPDRVAPGGGLLGDDSVELFAFATWVPGADDPLDPDSGWMAPLTFRDPETLEAFSPEQLDGLEVPEAFRKVAPPQRYKTGVIRLLFRCTNMESVRFVGGSGGDTVTSAQVTYDLSSLESTSDQASEGEWTHYDFALLLWHDKALTFHVQVLTGEPQLAELRQQRGEQLVFGERLRLQWLAREDGHLEKPYNQPFPPKEGVDPGLLKEITETVSEAEAERRGLYPGLLDDGTLIDASVLGDFEPEPDSNEEADANGEEEMPVHYQIEHELAVHLAGGVRSDGTKTPETFFRISNEDYLDHLARIDEDDEIIWDFSREGDSDEIEFASCGHTQSATDPLRLFFLPHMAELTFEIAGTPDLPNGRDIEDLFDQKIPRLTLDGDDAEDAESDLMSFIAVATQSGKDYSDIWEDEWPGTMPGDFTFRDTTPQELLNWYLGTSMAAQVKHHPSDHKLLINQTREKFWEKVVNFILRR